MRHLMHTLLLAAGLAGAPFAATAQAASYPESGKPIRIVVPYTAGGSSDFVARSVAAKLSENMKHDFVVENKPGGNTIIGAESVARANPDGYSLYLIGELTHSSLSALNRKLPFDPLKDFAAITNVVESPIVVSVPADFPANTLQEFIDYAKANPDAINFGTAGVGNTLHLAAEQFAKVTGIKMNHIQYKGASQAVVDLVAGRIQVMFDLPQTQLPHIQSGKVKALAISSRERLPRLPEVPTTTEAGLPGYVFSTRIGLAAPGGTPDAVRQKLHDEIVKAMQDPALVKAVGEMGMMPYTNASPQEAQERLAQSIAVVADLLSNYKPE